MIEYSSEDTHREKTMVRKNYRMLVAAMTLGLSVCGCGPVVTESRQASIENMSSEKNINRGENMNNDGFTTIMNTGYLDIVFYEEEEYISIALLLERDEVMEIGEQMQKKNPNAYMHGYNWEAFLNKYLEYNAPEILAVLDTDPEAGMYAAYINETDDHAKELAEKFGKIMQTLVEDKEVTLEFLEQYGDEIEWD